MTILMKARVKQCLFGLLLSSSMLSGCTVSEGDSTSALKADQAATPSPVQLPAVRLTRQPVVSIAALQADQTGETVAIAGNVAQRSPLLEGWLYQIKDETGSLWVVTSSSEPEVGQSVVVEGVVQYKAIVVDEIDSGEIYLEEQAYVPVGG